MKPEGSSSHLQKPATRPYPEPHSSIPRPPSNLSKTYFNIVPPIYAWVFQVAFFPQVLY
jgi:hypothetical protein